MPARPGPETLSELELLEAVVEVLVDVLVDAGVLDEELLVDSVVLGGVALVGVLLDDVVGVCVLEVVAGGVVG